MAGRRVTKNRKKKYECLFCQRLFSRYQNLECHMLVHTEERPYFCSECDTCLKTFSDHKEHFRVVHLGIKYTCPFCGQEFNALSNLCAHKTRIHGCGKTIKRPRVAAAAKPVVKKTKSKVANRKSLSKSKKTVVKSEPAVKTKNVVTPIAIPTHSNGRLRKMYKCDLCNRSFLSTDIGTLNRHKQRVHLIGPPPKPLPKKTVKFWKCDICGRVFRCHDRHSLFRHKASVHGISQKYLNQSIDKEPNLPFFFEPPPTPPPPQKQDGNLGDSDIDLKYSPVLTTFNVPPPPPHFNFHPPFKIPNFPAFHPPRKILDDSFFLHMNRYTPEDDDDSKNLTDSKISPPTYLPPQPQHQVKEESQENEVPPIPMAVEEVTVTPTIKVDTVVDPADLNIIKMEVIMSDDSVNDTRYGPPQRCEKCGNILANTASFQRHQLIADCVLLKKLRDNPISTLWYNCQFCQKDFGDRRSHLLRHIVALHRYPTDEDDLSDDKLISCAFCGLKFTSRQNTQKHILLNHHTMLGVPRKIGGGRDDNH